MISIFGKDIIDKIRGKSSDEGISNFDEDFSFSKRIWEAHNKAEERLRSEAPKFAKAFFTRPEERANPHYPPVFQGPFGDPTKEGPLTRDFDERFLRERSDNIETSEKTSFQNEPIQNSFERNQKKWEINQSFDYSNQYNNQKNEYKINNDPWRIIMEELQRIREQNAVIIEKLSSIERKLM